MEHKQTMNKDEIKLMMKNELLEQEKRISSEFRSELETQTTRLTTVVEKQNAMYSNQIVELNKDVATLNSVVNSLQNKISGVRAQMVVTATACTTLGGLIGFFVSQLIK
jgi:uncharacterized protein YlxW (UPF0749 family)